MGELIFDEGGFTYLEEGKTEQLLNLRDFLSNKSRIPLHGISEKDFTITSFLFDLFDKYTDINDGVPEPEAAVEYLLMNVLLSSFLMKSSAPARVLELGCNNGILSFYLASVVGKYHPRSSLCCVTNVIGNSSGNRFLDRISLVQDLPNLSMLASDYESTPLESGYFDVVAVNGTAAFENPFQVMDEAERLVKPGGMLLCYACNSPLLGDSFQIKFPDRKQYRLQTGLILTARRKKEAQTAMPQASWCLAAKDRQEEGERLLAGQQNPADREKIRKAISGIDAHIEALKGREEVRAEELEWKLRLIAVKEKLLERIV